MDVIEDIAWHLDEPFGDASAIPTYMVSRLAAQEVKVVLSGDGGDEIFGGYDKYRVEGRERLLQRIPGVARHLGGRLAQALPWGARGRRFLAHHALSGPQRILDSQTFFTDDDLGRLVEPDVRELLQTTAPWRTEAQWLRGPHWLSALQNLDLHTYLPLDILTKVDRMSMAHSLEVRVPLLDHEVVELAAQIPAHLQIRRGQAKYLFKHVLRRTLPPEILHRPKRGFAVPLDAWFRGRLDGFLRDLLLAPRSRARGILRPQGVRRLLSMHAAGRNLDLQLWTLASLELWCRRFLDAPPQIASHAVRAPRPRTAQGGG
jgi:asparagine synthase (glutamine-hydrolysing)